LHYLVTTTTPQLAQVAAQKASRNTPYDCMEATAIRKKWEVEKYCMEPVCR
jgi:hypothetical protein